MNAPTYVLDTGAARIAYVDTGPLESAIAPDQPPLVLIHGWAGTKLLWSNALPRLAPHLRCIALDLPGHGESPATGAESTLAELAGHVATVMDQLHLASAHVVGHSMGSLVALALALDHPDRVRSLVVSCPPHPESGAWSGRLVLDTPLELPALRAAHRFNQALGQWAPAAGGGAVGRRLRRSREAATVDVPTLQRTLHAVMRPGLADRLPEVPCPTLVLAGGFDLTAPPIGARRVAAAIPGAQLHVFPRTAHHPMDEQPDPFAAIVRVWAIEGELRAP